LIGPSPETPAHAVLASILLNGIAALTVASHCGRHHCVEHGAWSHANYRAWQHQFGVGLNCSTLPDHVSYRDCCSRVPCLHWSRPRGPAL